MPEQTTEEQAMCLLNAAPVEWDGLQASIDDAGRYEISRHLDALIQRAVRLKGYLEVRNRSGRHGSHDQAVKLSNKLTAEVRRALGYTTSNDINF